MSLRSSQRRLNCGNPRCGFDRIYCLSCGEELLLMLSCRIRGFFPSCHSKRLEGWGERMQERLLLDVPHRQVVFTIPKMLRIFFRYKRQLLGDLCQVTVDPLRCPKSQGQMRIIAFLIYFSVVDRIINHLKLSFVVDKPPPPRIAYQEVLMAAETSAEYFL